MRFPTLCFIENLPNKSLGSWPIAYRYKDGLIFITQGSQRVVTVDWKRWENWVQPPSTDVRLVENISGTREIWRRLAWLRTKMAKIPVLLTACESPFIWQTRGCSFLGIFYDNADRQTGRHNYWSPFFETSSVNFCNNLLSKKNSNLYNFMKKYALKFHDVMQWMFLFNFLHRYILIKVKETIVFLCWNCYLKHVTNVTDLRCIDKHGYGLMMYRQTRACYLSLDCINEINPRLPPTK